MNKSRFYFAVVFVLLVLIGLTFSPWVVPVVLAAWALGYYEALVDTKPLRGGKR